MELEFVSHVRDQVRTLLKIRCEREVPSESSKPPYGAKLFCGDIRMTVRSGMSDSLWRWLLDEGWREVVVRLDRRRLENLRAHQELVRHAGLAAQERRHRQQKGI